MVKIHTQNGEDDEEQNEDFDRLYNELRRKTHSIRNWEPDMILDLWELAETYDQQVKVRKLLKFIEAGRFYKALKNTRKFAVALDIDELKMFKEGDRWMYRWLKAYTTVEEVGPL